MTRPPRNLTTVALFAFAIFAMLALQSASAATFRVDDSGTTVFPALSEARWVRLTGRGLSFDVEATVRVNVRLHVSAWQGKLVRVYMTSPRGSTPLFRTTWKGGSVLLPGSIDATSRALVWTGKLAQSTLSDAVTVTLRADGRTLNTPQSLEFGFEIDVDS